MEKEIEVVREQIEQEIPIEQEDIYLNIGGTQNYNELTNKPQINSVTLQGNKTSSQLGLQDTLVSGTNIKTINHQPVLGSGNLDIDPAGGANLTPLEVPNDSMILYDFIMNAEIPKTYTISNDNDVSISIEKEAGTDEIWVQKGSIISVYPQYSATILSADGMYMYYVDFETGEYLTGGGAVDYDTVVQIVDDIVDTSNLVDLTSDQTITGKKTFKDSGIEFSKTGYAPKTGFEAGTNGLSLTFTDAQGNKSTKLGVGSQYTTTDQDFIPRENYSYNQITGEYSGTNLGKNDKRYNVLYARALSEDGQVIKPVANFLSNDKNLLPDSSYVRNIGSSSLRWYYLYLSGNIEMSVGDINQVRAITANEYRVKDGNFNNNYYSLLKYAYVSPGKTVAQLQNGIDVNNRVIHNIGTPDDDTSPISKGYADSHYQGTLTFDSTPTDGSSNPVTSDGVFDAIQNVTEIAEGKTATYTLSYSTTGNTDFNSQNNSITVSSFTDTAGNTITDADVKVGDIVLIVEVDVPDRWVQSIDTTNHTITFYKMETSKIDLNNYVDLTSAQTISGNKTFSGTLTAPIIKGASYIEFRNNNGVLSTMYNDNIIFNKRVQPNSDNSQDLGTSTKRWKDFYVSGNISDGTNSIAVEKIANVDDVVDLTSAQTISGNKTFSSTILPSTNNNIDLGLSSRKWGNAYVNNISDGTNSVAVNKIANKDNFVTLSQADYDALVTKDPDTFYFIEEE